MRILHLETSTSKRCDVCGIYLQRANDDDEFWNKHRYVIDIAGYSKDPTYNLITCNDAINRSLDIFNLNLIP